MSDHRSGVDRCAHRLACREWIEGHDDLTRGLPDAASPMLRGEPERLAAVAARMVADGLYSRKTDRGVIAWSIRVHVSRLRGQRIDWRRRWDRGDDDARGDSLSASGLSGARQSRSA